MTSLSPYVPGLPPQSAEMRDKVNRGILNLIRSGGQPDVAKVFVGYTGRGGLHGLRYSDFANRHAYTEAKRVIEQGQFFTPDSVVGLIASFLAVPKGESVADMACGAGAFANHFLSQRFFGSDVDADAVTVARYLYPEARIVEGDLRSFSVPEKFRFVVGNPPFALRWSTPHCPMASDAGEASSEDVFLWRLHECMATGGSACFVTPASWLNDDIVHAKALGFIERHFERVAEVLLPVDTFAGVGVEAFSTKIVLLRAFLPDEGFRKTLPVVIDGRGKSLDNVLNDWRGGCRAYFTYRKGLGGMRANLAHEDQKAARESKAAREATVYRFLRLHAEIERRAPAIAATFEKKWAEATAPASFDKDGKRIAQIGVRTVFRQLRAALRAIDNPPKSLVRIIRTKAGITVKAFNRSAAIVIADHKFFVPNHEIAYGDTSFNCARKKIESVKRAIAAHNADHTRDPIGFEDLNVEPLFRGLRSRFELWNRPLSADFDGIEDKRESMRSFYASLVRFGIEIKEPQVEALARVVAKPGAFLAWEPGTGKSLAGVAWDRAMRQCDHKFQRRQGWTLIVSSALAIELHWREMCATYGYYHQQPCTRDDWKTISKDQIDGQGFLLASHYQIGKYSKIIRGLVRQGIITSLIVDESDEFGNSASLRTQALGIAGREVRHKLIMTGTPVRNKASELFPQLALLLHGEPFFRCVGPIKYTFKASTGEFKMEHNDHFRLPYQGRGALALFKRCHAPSRPTVMGAEKSYPVLPAREELESFLACFRSRILLRSLQKHEPFERTTIPVVLSTEEREVYEETAKNAKQLARRLMKSTQTERRANMLSLAHAIRVLQQAASMPERMGFKGTGAKTLALIDGIRSSKASHVAVGVIWRESIEVLLPRLEIEFPDRLIVAFDGEDSFSKRRKKLEALKRAPRGLLLCTQQSVRSSLNLPIVSEVFAESFPWNFTALNQWAMRFCRLTSKATVKVNLIMAQGTIEERILGLLVCKERIALPIAGDDFEHDDELFATYGIPAADLDDLARYLTERDPNIRENQKAVMAA